MAFDNPGYDELYKRLGQEDTGTVLLQPETIIDIHDALISRFGGIFGLRDDDLFRSVAVAPFQTMFGAELFPTVFDKAAKYLFDFANYQVFLDGNKRTGFGVCAEFLSRNGFELTLTKEEGYILVMDIANHKYNDSSEVVGVLKSHFEFCEKSSDGVSEQVSVYDMFGPMR
jgi:death-on-curing protein